MSHYYTVPVVDIAELAEARRMIGPDFARIVGYFQEDGTKAILAIEQAMLARSARDLALPAHKLKGEARQFGAIRLGDIAEAIEKTARGCIEKQTTPDEVAGEVAMLRACFAETMQALAPTSNRAPLMPAPTAGMAPATPPSPPLQPAGFQGTARPLAGRAGTFGRRISSS